MDNQIEAPFLSSGLSQLPAEDLAYYMQEFNHALLADDAQRKRGIRNMMAYTSLDSGQWSKSLQAELRKQGYVAQQYNFIQFLVRGHVGNAIMNAIDPKFLDAQTDLKDDSAELNVYQNLYYSDKNLYGYGPTSMKTFEDGLVYRGCEELVIDEPSSDPRTHRLKFESVRSDLLIFDQTNLTDEISRNSRKCHKVSYLTPKQMLQVFDDKEYEILKALVDEQRRTAESPDRPRIDRFNALDGEKRIGNRYQTVEFYHVESEKVVKQLYNGQILPIAPEGLNSDADWALKAQWALQNGTSIMSERIITLNEYQPVLYKTTFVPQLGLVLNDKKDRRQLNGHLPFYCWSFIQKWGMSIGLVDLLVDPQNDLNKREQAKTKALTQSPIMGKSWISEDIIPEGSDKTMADYVADANDCSKPYVTPAGVPGNTLFGVVGGSQINPGLLQDIGEKADFMNRIGSLPPAMQGFTGNSAESGIAIGRKVIEGSVMQRLPMETFIKLQNDKAEDWLTLAITLYGGDHNLNRVFTKADGTTFTTNEMVGYGPDGEPIIGNRVSELTRPQVIVTETKENDFLKQAQREMDIAALQAIPPSPTNDSIRAAFECSLASRMDFTDDKEKEMAITAARKRYELAMVNTDLQIANAKMQLAQLQGTLMAPPAPASGIPAPPAQSRQVSPQGAPSPEREQDVVNAARFKAPDVERTVPQEAAPA